MYLTSPEHFLSQLLPTTCFVVGVLFPHADTQAPRDFEMLTDLLTGGLRGKTRIPASSDSETRSLHHCIARPRSEACSFLPLTGHRNDSNVMFPLVGSQKSLAVIIDSPRAGAKGPDTLEPSVLITSYAGSYEGVTVAAGLRN